MKLTSEMVSRIKEIAEEHDYDYDCIGVRVQDVPFELGEISHCSSVWVDGEETDELLDGICVISVSELGRVYKSSSFYFGDHVAVIGGNINAYGEDDGEVILENAEVIEIIE